MSDFLKKRVFPILFMFLVTAVCITTVSAIFLSTEDIVRANEAASLKRAVLFAAGIDVPESALEAVAIFDARIESVNEDSGNEYWRVTDGSGNLAGYVVPVSGPGLWGTIEAVVGFEPGLKTMTGIDFVAQNETPGLGARITEDWFKEQFRQKTPPFVLVPEGTENNAPNEIDAITGASRTSNFVRQLVNKAPAEAQQTVN